MNNNNQNQRIFNVSTEFINGYVMDDRLPFVKLWKWVLLSIFMVIILVVSINIFFAQYIQEEKDRIANQSGYYFDTESLYSKQKNHLNQFGIIDKENKVFHIPIDSSFQLVIEDYKQ